MCVSEAWIWLKWATKRAYFTHWWLCFIWILLFARIKTKLNPYVLVADIFDIQSKQMMLMIETSCLVFCDAHHTFAFARSLLLLFFFFCGCYCYDHFVSYSVLCSWMLVDYINSDGQLFGSAMIGAFDIDRAQLLFCTAHDIRTGNNTGR